MREPVTGDCPQFLVMEVQLPGIVSEVVMLIRGGGTGNENLRKNGTTERQHNSPRVVILKKNELPRAL